MSNTRRYALLLLDISIFCIALILTVKVRALSTLYFFTNSIAQEYPLINYNYFAYALLFHLVYLYISGFYEESLRVSLLVSLIKLLIGSAILFGVISIGFYLTNPFKVPRSIPLTFITVNFILLAACRLSLFYFWNTYDIRKILVIGQNPQSLRLLRELRGLQAYRTQILGVVTENEKIQKSRHYVYPVLGTWKKITQILDEVKPDLVILSLIDSKVKEHLIESIPSRFFQKIFFYISPSIYEIMIGRPQYIRINDIPLIRIRKSFTRIYALKRVFDIVFSLIGIVLTLPIMLGIYVVVKLTSKGPAIFVQERVGRDEVLFKIYKFRTMFVEASKVISQAKKYDRRITPVGGSLRALRLDELPQLFNILIGDMSFIGPRPLVLQEVERFKELDPAFAERFIAMPGLTGLAQVHGDYSTGPDEKLKYDLWYCYHYNPLMDLSIVFRTIKTVLLRKGT